MSLAENLKPLHIHQQLHKVVSSKRWDEFEDDVVSDGFPLSCEATILPSSPASVHQASAAYQLRCCMATLHNSTHLGVAVHHLAGANTRGLDLAPQ